MLNRKLGDRTMQQEKNVHENRSKCWIATGCCWYRLVASEIAIKNDMKNNIIKRLGLNFMQFDLCHLHWLCMTNIIYFIVQMGHFWKQKEMLYSQAWTTGLNWNFVSKSVHMVTLSLSPNNIKCIPCFPWTAFEQFLCISVYTKNIS